MLLDKLLVNGIDGKVYDESIKCMYRDKVTWIRFNDTTTEWIDCTEGVKQGDILSPTLFSIFVNDFVDEIGDIDLGVKVSDISISVLLICRRYYSKFSVRKESPSNT
jgi:hypothetical protein